MALQKQPLPVQFEGGVDTKTDSKQVASVKLLDLQNATFIKQMTLAKRNGYHALGNTVEGTMVALAKPQGLGVRGTELVKFDGAQAYSYLPNTDRWSPAGDIMSVTASSDPIARTGAYQQQPDYAYNGGVAVTAWEDAVGNVWYSVLEAASKRVIVQPTSLGTGQRPRCLAVGTVLHVLYAVPASNAINVAIINPTFPAAVVAPQILVSELSTTTPIYDACTTNYNSDNPGLIAFVTPLGGGYTYKVGFIAPSGVLGSPLTGLPSVAAGNDPISTTIGCAWNGAAMVSPICTMGTDTGGPFFRFWSSALVTGASGSPAGSYSSGSRRIALAFATALVGGQDAVRWAIDVGASDDSTNLVRTGYADTTGTSTLNAPILQHGLVTRAWSYNGDAYVTLVHPVKLFSYAVAIKLRDGTGYNSTVAARVVAGQSPGLPARTHLPSAIVNGGDVQIPLLYKIQLVSTNGDKFSEIGIRLYDLNFASSSAWHSIQFGRGLAVASACMQYYDGDRVAEIDFHCAPDTTAGTITLAQGTGGGLTLTDTYGYKFVYEEVDGQGELHRGPVSVAQLITLTGGNNAVTATIPTYALTAKRRVRLGIYRSAGNATGTDATIPYFRIASIDPTTSAQPANGYVLNDPTVSTVTFVDQMSDVTLLTQEPLYTNGGVLSNDPPSMGGSMLTTGADRLFWDDAEDPDVVHYSQPRADETSAELAAALSFRVDRYGGKIIGIGVMDDAVLIFKETAVYVVVGAGPDITGGVNNGSFSPAQLLTSDVGCKSPNSICQTPIGITFQSSKGIMLMGRDRQVVDIGRDVYAYNSQTIVRATLLPDRHQVLFLTNAGRSLLYDYEKQQWSTFTNHTGLDAVVLSGTYHYLRTDGRVFKETPGLYKDDNAHIPMVIETAWIKMTGYLQGWQRIIHAYFIGAYLSQHTLRLRYRIDYQDAYSAPIDMNVDSNYTPSIYGAGVYGGGYYGGTGLSNTVYQRRVHLNKRCQAMSFQIQDVEGADSYGAAFQLSELLLIGGVLGPDFKVGAARSS